MIKLSVVQNRIASPPLGAPAPLLTFSRLDILRLQKQGRFFVPLARSFWGLGKSTERGTKQRAGKTVTLLNRWGRKAQRLSGWRLIPGSGQEIDQERHGQRDCLTVTANANAGIRARDVKYLLGPRELSFLKAFPLRSLR